MLFAVKENRGQVLQSYIGEGGGKRIKVKRETKIKFRHRPPGTAIAVGGF